MIDGCDKVLTCFRAEFADCQTARKLPTDSALCALKTTIFTTNSALLTTQTAKDTTRQADVQDVLLTTTCQTSTLVSSTCQDASTQDQPALPVLLLSLSSAELVPFPTAKLTTPKDALLVTANTTCLPLELAWLNKSEVSMLEEF